MGFGANKKATIIALTFGNKKEERNLQSMWDPPPKHNAFAFAFANTHTKKRESQIFFY